MEAYRSRCHHAEPLDHSLAARPAVLTVTGGAQSSPFVDLCGAGMSEKTPLRALQLWLHNENKKNANERKQILGSHARNTSSTWDRPQAKHVGSARVSHGT